MSERLTQHSLPPQRRPLMRNVVLPRDVVERVRDFMYPHVFDLQGGDWAPARALLAALDAALAAPEPFRRREDALVVGSGPTYYSVTQEDDDTFGRIIHVYEENHNSGDSHECIGDVNNDVRALGFALLAITEATP